jgi:hypothetical protein
VVGTDYTHGSAAGTGCGASDYNVNSAGYTTGGVTGTESFGSDQVVERPVGVGVAEVPVVVTEQQRVHTGERCCRCCCCCCCCAAACAVDWKALPVSCRIHMVCYCLHC